MVNRKRLSRLCGRVGSSTSSMWADKLHWRQKMPGTGGGRAVWIGVERRGQVRTGTAVPCAAILLPETG